MDILTSLFGIAVSLGSFGLSSYGLYNVLLDHGLLARIPAVDSFVASFHR
ncbi:hypothetical protein [uncultured Corynebacterium sp.]|nr:hypothetical protein [uncultured Corynebacterium sp.]